MAIAGNQVQADYMLEFEYCPTQDFCIMRARYSEFEYCRVLNIRKSPEVMIANPGVAVSIGAINRLLAFVEDYNKRADVKELVEKKEGLEKELAEATGDAEPVSKVVAFHLIYKGWVKLEGFTDEEQALIHRVPGYLAAGVLYTLARLLDVEESMREIDRSGFDTSHVVNALKDALPRMSEEEQALVRHLVDGS